ncbi:MAG: NADP-dependent oxidoreductase [Pseudomonadota bacterium]
MAELRQIVLAKRPDGVPTVGHFRLDQAPMPEPEVGEVLVRTLWFSLDPYQRGLMDAGKSYTAPVPVGGKIRGGGVGEVIASRHAGFAEGDIVLAGTGWASHALDHGDALLKLDPGLAPVQTALGVLGMPGHTGWVGLTDIAEARADETIVVSAATGAVGSLVGQLAKHRGLRVIGVAGGADKCAYAVETLGFDACIDHRAAEDWRGLSKEISTAAPDGVDIYFENVGGQTLNAVVPLMNQGGRIPICGMISWYSGQDVDKAMPLPRAWLTILTQRLRVQGFIITDHQDRFRPFQEEVAPLVASGQIAYRETVTDGLEQAPAAFLSMLDGGNFGKQLVRVAE